jgi:hypothetical protein
MSPGPVRAGLIVLLIWGPTVAAAPCPPLPGPIPEPAQAAVPDGSGAGLAAPRTAVAWHGGYDETPFGVGHLRVENADRYFYDWPQAQVLPLWSRPDGAFLGWLHGARVHPADGAPSYPLTGAGMVETGYEHLSFMVDATAGDGWLQLRLRPGADGRAWTHACHLRLGPVELGFQPWADYLAEHGDWLHFRTRVAHALRTEPDRDSRRVTWIGLDHEVTLLEIAGDWMRVRVDQPGWHCSGAEPPADLRRDEGWVRWRDDASGPWLWVYTRGC